METWRNKTILDGIQGLPDASRTMASAWARGEVDTMQAYLQAHPLTPPCWRNLTDKALANEQGLDLDARERDAWLAALNKVVAVHPVVFTTAPVQDIINHAGRVKWLLSEGYREVSSTEQSIGTSGAGQIRQ